MGNMYIKHELRSIERRMRDLVNKNNKNRQDIMQSHQEAPEKGHVNRGHQRLAHPPVNATRCSAISGGSFASPYATGTGGHPRSFSDAKSEEVSLHTTGSASSRGIEVVRSLSSAAIHTSRAFAPLGIDEPPDSGKHIINGEKNDFGEADKLGTLEFEHHFDSTVQSDGLGTTVAADQGFDSAVAGASVLDASRILWKDSTGFDAIPERRKLSVSSSVFLHARGPWGAGDSRAGARSAAFRRTLDAKASFFDSNKVSDAVRGDIALVLLAKTRLCVTWTPRSQHVRVVVDALRRGTPAFVAPQPTLRREALEVLREAVREWPVWKDWRDIWAEEKYAEARGESTPLVSSQNMGKEAFILGSASQVPVFPVDPVVSVDEMLTALYMTAKVFVCEAEAASKATVAERSHKEVVSRRREGGLTLQQCARSAIVFSQYLNEIEDIIAHMRDVGFALYGKERRYFTVFSALDLYTRELQSAYYRAQARSPTTCRVKDLVRQFVECTVPVVVYSMESQLNKHENGDSDCEDLYSTGERVQGEADSGRDNAPFGGEISMAAGALVGALHREATGGKEEESSLPPPRMGTQRMDSFASLLRESSMRQLRKHDTAARAARLISHNVTDYISGQAAGSTRILTNGLSYLVARAVLEASEHSDVRLVVNNCLEAGVMQKLLRRRRISVTLIHPSKLASIMPSIDIVLLGVDAVLADGGVVADVGTHQIALLASVYKKPTCVLAESFKFTRLVATSQKDIDLLRRDVRALDRAICMRQDHGDALGEVSRGVEDGVCSIDVYTSERRCDWVMKDLYGRLERQLTRENVASRPTAPSSTVGGARRQTAEAGVASARPPAPRELRRNSSSNWSGTGGGDVSTGDGGLSDADVRADDVGGHDDMYVGGAYGSPDVPTALSSDVSRSGDDSGQRDSSADEGRDSRASGVHFLVSRCEIGKDSADYDGDGIVGRDRDAYGSLSRRLGTSGSDSRGSGLVRTDSVDSCGGHEAVVTDDGIDVFVGGAEAVSREPVDVNQISGLLSQHLASGHHEDYYGRLRSNAGTSGDGKISGFIGAVAARGSVVDTDVGPDEDVGSLDDGVGSWGPSLTLDNHALGYAIRDSGPDRTELRVVDFVQQKDHGDYGGVDSGLATGDRRHGRVVAAPASQILDASIADGTENVMDERMLGIETEGVHDTAVYGEPLGGVFHEVGEDGYDERHDGMALADAVVPGDAYDTDFNITVVEDSVSSDGDLGAAIEGIPCGVVGVNAALSVGGSGPISGAPSEVSGGATGSGVGDDEGIVADDNVEAMETAKEKREALDSQVKGYLNQRFRQLRTGHQVDYTPASLIETIITEVGTMAPSRVIGELWRVFMPAALNPSATRRAL